MEFNKERLEFGQIILGHIQHILKLSRCWNSIQLFQNSVMVLSDALYSYYDDEMEKQYVVFEEKTNKENRDYRFLFRNLLALVKRNDYFKGAVYGDSESDNEIVEDDDGGEE